MTAPAVALLERAAGLADRELDDWGAVPEPLGEPVSRTSGLLLTGGGGAFPEAGYWRCTEGSWRCETARAEFCHFLEGECVYTGDDGAAVPISAGDTAWFPAGWSGRCDVGRAVGKVYVIL